MELTSPNPADVLRACIERYNSHDPRGVDLVAANTLDQGIITTPEDWRRKWQQQWDAVPDMQSTIEHTLEAGDWVAHRYTIRGTGPDGPIEMLGLDMVRVQDGRIVEHWAAAVPLPHRL